MMIVIMTNHRKLFSFFKIILILFAFFPVLVFGSKKNSAPKGAEKIKKTLIIYLENHSFFNLFALFPGDVNNEPPPGYQGQINESGEVYKVLPAVKGRKSKTPDSRFPKELPNKPFLIDPFVKKSEFTPDPVHEFFTHQVQINNGHNDKFVLHSHVGAFALGYYDMADTYLWKLAKDYVLADEFYQSAFGGSFLNHQWLIAAQTPTYPNAPESLKTILDSNGLPKKNKPLTPDNFVVNTIQPYHPPFAGDGKNAELRLPTLDYATIGDRLSEKKISWAWYAGGWNAILKKENPGNFQFHHQPFLYFKNYGPDTQGRKEHLKDEIDLIEAIQSEQLPEVSFYKPVGVDNIHPGYADVSTGDAKLKQIMELLMKSKQWQQTLVIITFDEHGGFWDPKSPQKLDRWGLGSRIPAIFVSPHVRKGYVDHTHYETVSILSYLEKKYAIAPFSDRDKNANPLSGIWVP